MSFLRRDLAAQGIVACAEAAAARDGKQLTTAGLVLVRQRPGSARGVLFITIEDETGIANIVVWPDLFEKQRRVVLSAAMISVTGRVQREGEVVHVVAQTLADLSPLLRSVGERDDAGMLPSQGGRAMRTDNPDAGEVLGRKLRDADIPEVRRCSGIKMRTRDFR